MNAQGEGGNGSAGGDGGDADEGYAAWIAELKECLLQAGVHNRPAALMGDASLLSEATLRDVGALLTGGVDVRVGGLCLQEAGIYTHAEEEQVAANCRQLRHSQLHRSSLGGSSPPLAPPLRACICQPPAGTARRHARQRPP